MARVLVADDDAHLREVVRFALERDGHDVVEVADGLAAVAAAGAADVIVLDVVMPELDGLEACRRIRAASAVPILMLSSRDEELDRILGLEIGADDYVTKPFSPRELATRVKTLLRRVALDAAGVAPGGDGPVVAGELSMDAARHTVSWAEQPLTLTVIEFELLLALARRPGNVLTRGQLVEHAWGPAHAVSDRTVDSHVRRIRAKLRAVGADPIETVHGLGYRLGG